MAVNVTDGVHNSMLLNEQRCKKRRTLLQQLRRHIELSQLEVATLSHPRVEQLKQDAQFDLVVFDYLSNDFNVVIAAHFQCPSVMISNHAINLPARNLNGNPSVAAFTKSLHLEGSLKMSFAQRLLNHITVGIEQLFLAAFDYYHNRAVYEQYFPAHEAHNPSYREAKRNISLVLVGSSFLQNGPVLSFPSIREVSGLHIPPRNVANALPADLQHWFDASEKDVIYMSFGSHVNGIDMSPVQRDAFLAVFKRLNGHRVLWKWESDVLPGKPDNVRIGQWFPQSDVLAHPKVKLFVSHCGLGASSEARNNGVPVLGIPLSADQFDNLERMVDEGWAKEIRLSAVTEETLQPILLQLLEDENIQRRAKIAAKQYRDRPMHPLDEAIFWVEYVIRHSGAKHMQSQAVDMNWCQYHSLDVYGFLIGVAFVAWKILEWIAKLVVIRLHRRKDINCFRELFS